MMSFGLRLSPLLAIFLIAGCAYKQASTGINDTVNQAENAVLTSIWSGRISLQVQGEPPQAFFAGFELKGQASSGELTLLSPLGNILGIMRWSPTEALLEQGTNTRRFASTDDLLLQTTGAAVPVPALFDWLAGKNTAAPGWTPDLSQQFRGLITAKRSEPAPPADLRIVLNK